MIQFLEDVLSHSIALKKDVKHTGRISKQEADQCLAKYRKLPLGPAIKNAIQTHGYNQDLINELIGFLPERNWLVHHSVIQISDSIPASRCNLLVRVESIANKAKAL